MTQAGPVLHVRYQKRGLGLLIGGIGFLAVAMALTVDMVMPWGSDPLHWMMGASVAVELVFIAVLAVGAARAVVRAMTGRPLLSLDADGVLLHSVRLRVAWSDVAQIRLVQTRPGSRTMMLVFVPHDPGRVAAGRGPWARLFARDYTRRLGSPIVAPVDDVAAEVDEMLRVARHYTDAPVRRQYSVGGAVS